jgi:hypothetical protein
LDIRTTRELALQISGIGKIVYTGARHRHSLSAAEARASDDPGRSEPAAAIEGTRGRRPDAAGEPHMRG